MIKAMERLKKARDHSKNWRTEAREDFDFYIGDQWNREDRQILEEELRPPITFNRVAPVINAVVGHEVSNRQEVRFYPREKGDDHPTEILTDALKWVDDQCDAEDEVSDAFKDMIICGMGWTETRLSYDEDMDGKIHSAERTDPIEMFWDPTARKRNLSDAQWVGRLRWIPKEEATSKWPKITELDTKESIIDKNDFGYEPHDSSPPFYEEESNTQWYRPHKEDFRIFQYQYWTRKTVYRVEDEGGELRELSEKKFSKMKPLLEASGKRYVKQLKKTYYQDFYLGDHKLESKMLECEHFTLRCMTGHRDNTNGVWHGLVTGMKDPQRWSNKFFSNIQDMLSRNRQGGAFVEEDALVDPRKAEEDWNRPDAMIMLAPGALSKGKIQERNPVQYPNGMDRMLQFSITSIPDVSGVNLELMGLADRQQAGVLEAQRKRSGLTILSSLFDSLRKFQKERGRVVLYYIQNYISDGRLIRILGQDGKPEFIPLVKQTDAKYDVIVDEAPHSVNRKEETFAMLREIIPQLISTGIPIPPEVLDYIPVPQALANKWKEALQGQGDPKSQEQMQKMQQEIQKLNEENQKLQQEKQSKMQEIQMKGQESDAELQLKAKEIDAELALKERELTADLILQERKVDGELEIKRKAVNNAGGSNNE